MFQDFKILVTLITGPVFARMFSVMTLFTAWDLIKGPFVTLPRTARPPSLLASAVVFVANVGLAVLLLWYFRHMLRKARAAEDGDYFDMTRRSWIAVLWCSFVAGIGCGCVMFFQLI